MKKSLLKMSAILLAVTLAGCETAGEQGSGVQQGASVTRFHLGQPVARGEIRIEPTNPDQTNSLEFSQLAGAVERELTRLGWTVSNANLRSEQVALVRVDQGSREAMRSRSGVSVGVGGGTGGWGGGGGGVGVGGTIPVGGSRSNEIVVTELGVRIQRRSDATVYWEGRADLEARSDSPLADRRAAVDRLAAALFQDFPGESGRTIRVR
jgi:predicted small secreted protein